MLSEDEIAELYALSARLQQILQRARGSAPADMEEARITEKCKQMAEICREKGHKIDFDRCVDERAASELLGLARQTLRNDRSGPRLIPYRTCGRRVSYAIRGLARYWLSRIQHH